MAKTKQLTNAPNKIPRTRTGIKEHHCNGLHEELDLKDCSVKIYLLLIHYEKTYFVSWWNFGWFWMTWTDWVLVICLSFWVTLFNDCLFWEVIGGVFGIDHTLLWCLYNSEEIIINNVLFDACLIPKYVSTE